MVLLQVSGAVGTNLRGVHRSILGGFHRNVGAGYAARILTCFVRHVHAGTRVKRFQPTAKFFPCGGKNYFRYNRWEPAPPLVHVPQSRNGSANFAGFRTALSIMRSVAVGPRSLIRATPQDPEILARKRVRTTEILRQPRLQSSLMTPLPVYQAQRIRRQEIYTTQHSKRSSPREDRFRRS